MSATITPQLAQVVSDAIETLYLASPRSPRAVEARNNPDRYTELYATGILGAPLEAVPVAVTRIIQADDHFPSVARFRAEVFSVAKQHFSAEPRQYRPPPSDRAHHCCGSEYGFRRFRAPMLRRGEPVVDDFGEPVMHEYEGNICDCEAERRVARGEEEITLSKDGTGL